MKLFLKFSAVLCLVLLVLVACSEGGSDAPAELTAVQGFMADPAASCRREESNSSSNL